MSCEAVQTSEWRKHLDFAVMFSSAIESLVPCETRKRDQLVTVFTPYMVESIFYGNSPAFNEIDRLVDDLTAIWRKRQYLPEHDVIIPGITEQAIKAGLTLEEGLSDETFGLLQEGLQHFTEQFYAQVAIKNSRTHARREDRNAIRRTFVQKWNVVEEQRKKRQEP